MSWKERLLRSLPLVAALAGTTTFMVTEEQWALLIAITGVWLMDSPIPGTVAVARALKRRPNVSRETLTDDEYDLPKDESVDEFRTRIKYAADTISVPCVVMHGSAEPHIRGCEGWRWPSE